MLKQLKLASTIGALALLMTASAGAFAQTVGADDPQPALGKAFFTERTMRNMDKNKDGMVSRQEFLDYMGAQFDKMDPKKKGMLNKGEFMDSKMMGATFGSIQ